MPSPALLPGILQFGLIPCDRLGANKNDVCRYEGRAMQIPQKSQLSLPFTWTKVDNTWGEGERFSISLLARGGLERWEDEGLPWRDTQDLAIPYYFTPEGATSLNQTAEGSGDLGPTSNFPDWLHEVPARGRLHRQLQWHFEGEHHHRAPLSIRLTDRLIQKFIKVLLFVNLDKLTSSQLKIHT